MAIRMKGTLLAASLLLPGLLLAGCGGLGAKMPDQLINLTALVSAPPGEVMVGPAERAIIVHSPETSRMMNVTRVPVRVDASTVTYLKNAVWVARPARLFRGVLAETIRAETGRLVLETGEYDIKGRQELTGQLLDMGYDARDQAVVVRYDAVLKNAQGEVRSRRFEAVVSGVAAKAAEVAPALNEAANIIAIEVAAWVGD